jgi:hypothetical protein
VRGIHMREKTKPRGCGVLPIAHVTAGDRGDLGQPSQRAFWSLVARHSSWVQCFFQRSAAAIKQPSKPNSPFAVWGHAGKGNGARTSDLLHHRLCSLRTRRRSSALRPLMSRSMSNSASMRLTASSAIGEIAVAFPPAPCVSGDRRLRDLKSADFESLRPVSTGGRIPTEWVAGLRRNGSRASLGIRNQARRYPALTIPCHSCILPVG